MQKINSLSAELPARLKAMPPTVRAQACVKLGDIVWAAIRTQVRAKSLTWLGDFAWSLIRAHLLHTSKVAGQPPDHKELHDTNPVWN